MAVSPKLSQTEGAGKIGNYMAMGLPIVAFDTTISHEYLGRLGIYAQKGDPRSLAAKLCEVLDNPERFSQVGRQLREQCVATLSWDAATDRIEAVYEMALARRAGRTVPTLPKAAVTQASRIATQAAVQIDRPAICTAKLQSGSHVEPHQQQPGPAGTQPMQAGSPDEAPPTPQPGTPNAQGRGGNRQHRNPQPGSANPNTGTEEFSLRDPDGYYVTISALSSLELRGHEAPA